MHNYSFFEEMGYRNIREVPGQGICGVMDMMFTVGVFCHLSDDIWGAGYQYRYCFPKELPSGTAEKALAEWTGETMHIGGPWIKCKGRGCDILNPDYEKIFAK